MINISDLFSDNNAKIAAKEFVEHFIKHANSANLDFDFYVNQGKMVSGEVNTSLRFNSDDATFLRNLMDQVRENDITEELSNALFEFEKKICSEMQLLLDDNFRNTARKIVLGEAEPFIFPLKKIIAKKTEINPSFDLKADGGYTLQVQKLAPKGYVFSKSIAGDLIKKRMETGKSFDELIEEGKASGDRDYKYVSGYVKKYFDSEFFIGLWIDYSPAPFDDVKKYLEEKEAQKNDRSNEGIKL